MTSPIPIGKVGRIVAGPQQGSYIEVRDDTANTGGYLILLGHDRDFTAGADDWVADLAQLQSYFANSGWKIAWAE